jgi:hypothetical protein
VCSSKEKDNEFECQSKKKAEIQIQLAVFLFFIDTTFVMLKPNNTLIYQVKSKQTHQIK